VRPETISYIEWFGCAFCSIRVAKIVNDIYTHLEDVAANGTGGLAACGKPFILKKCNHFVRSEKKKQLGGVLPNKVRGISSCTFYTLVWVAGKSPGG